MIDEPKKSEVPEKKEAPVPTIAPAINPRTGERGTRVMIIGARTIGSAVAHALMAQGVARHYAMLDTNEPRVKAGALDIARGNQFASVSTVEGLSDIAIIKGSDTVVITTGDKQKPGQSRLKLVGTTIDIMKSTVLKAAEQTSDAIYLIVASPVDAVTCTGQKLSGLSNGRFFGSGTVLDSSRLRYLITLVCGVAPQSVHVYIADGHGDSEIPLWGSTVTDTMSLLRWGQTVDGKLLDDGVHEAIHHDIVHSAYNIIEGKGVTNYAIGISVASILGSIARDEHRILPISFCSED